MSLYDYLKTSLSPSEYLRFYIDKMNSPFANDSGEDYDLAGYWKKYGTLTPSVGSQYGHLTDEFKLPNHFTYGWDWSRPELDWATKRGMI